MDLPSEHNPISHISREAALKCQQETYFADHTDKAWRVSIRPAGPDGQRVWRTGICFDAGQWNPIGRYTYQTRDEAAEKVKILGGDSLRQTSENEWILHGMRYKVEEREGCQSAVS